MAAAGTCPTSPRRWYVTVLMALTVTAVLNIATAQRRATTRNICERDPPDIRVDSMPGDHGFRIQILGHAVRYTPGQVYTGTQLRI